jgi:hypothetical protein
MQLSSLIYNHGKQNGHHDVEPFRHRAIKRRRLTAGDVVQKGKIPRRASWERNFSRDTGDFRSRNDSCVSFLFFP